MKPEEQTKKEALIQEYNEQAYAHDYAYNHGKFYTQLSSKEVKQLKAMSLSEVQYYLNNRKIE